MASILLSLGLNNHEWMKMMVRNIMVLFDSACVRGEALKYSTELAKRIDAALVLLMILPFDVSENTANVIESMIKLGGQVKDTLNRHADTIRNLGIPVETAVRIGNPRSELVKFLAESGKFQTIVWGGKPNLMRRKAHWLVHVQDIVKCAVVVPFLKDKAKG